MKLATPKNANYAAQVVRINTVVELAGLDNLVGVPVLGFHALTTRGIEAGELCIVFTAETALSDEYAHWNQLYRDKTLNKGYNPHSWEGTSGYLEANRRVRAIKLRGHVSNALLMPLSSLYFTGPGIADLVEGDTFDSINGHDICQKYELPVKQGSRPASKIEKAFKRVTDKQLPQHVDTDSYWRNKHLLDPDREVVLTAKVHGTSWRGGRVPVLRQLKWHEKVLKRVGVNIPEWEWDVIFGSRKVIKDPGNDRQQHFYVNDIWTEYGRKIADLIPEGMIIYGELVGWTPDGKPLQANYTYGLPQGEAELLVYRVCNVNRHGNLSDLSWSGVREFCTARGLKWVPELCRMSPSPDAEYTLDDHVSFLMDKRFVDMGKFTDEQLSLSDKKTVDEGIVIRQDGLIPTLLKAKSPEFLIHESRQLDTGVADIESAA